MKTLMISALFFVLLLSAMKDFAQSNQIIIAACTPNYQEYPTVLHQRAALASSPHSALDRDTANIKKRIVGFAFFSPLRSHLEFDYEQAAKNQMSLTGALGIIGPGITTNESNPSGAYIKVGPKFYFSPDWMMNGMYRCNDLQGAYIKPEIILNYYSATSSIEHYSYSTEERKSYLAFAFMLNFGKQWVVANIFAVDVHIGFGYGAGSNDDAYSHIGGGTTAFAASGGITIGIPLK